MDLYIRSKVIKIGNSRGIRIPHALLEQAGLTDEVEMKILNGQLVIRSASSPRQGWEAQFAAMSARGDDQLLDQPLSTDWDEDEWQWE